MTYRTRVALAIGGICAVAIAVISLAASLIASHVMHQSVDESLARRVSIADEFEHLTASAPVTSSLFDGFNGTGPRVQLIDADGEVTFPAGFDALPEDRAIATGTSAQPTYRFDDVGGRRLRILTAPHLGGGAVQVAEDVTDLEIGLRRLRLLLIPTGVLTGAAVGLIAWWRSRRLILPLTEIADAAEAITGRRHADVLITSPGGSELDRLADSFNEMSRALRVAEQQQRLLVGDVGHDLRTPLTGLRLKAEFLQQTHDLTDEQRAHLTDAIVGDTVALDALVHELLDLARGELADETETFDVDAVLTTEVARFRTATGRTVAVDSVTHEIVGHPRLVGRALSNLLHNAHKYSPSGQPIDVLHRVDGGTSHIAVRDRGPGVPEVERAVVFERGRRGSAAADTDGSGIGLSVVAHAARLHRGTTSIDGRAGGGASIGFGIQSVGG